MARDYGLALSLSGFLVLALHRQTRRSVVLFTLVTLLLSLPWYLRNWVLAGNPLYPHALISGFRINEVFEALQYSFHEKLAFYNHSPAEWSGFLKELWIGAPIAISGGLLCMLLRCRRSIPFLSMAGMMVFLWLLSMRDVGGGPIYSMRVLTPTFIALAFLAGRSVDYLFESQNRYLVKLRSVTLALLMVCSCYSLASALSHPFWAGHLFSAMTYTHVGPPEFNQYSQDLADRLQASDLKTTGVLTSNPYLGTSLQRTTRFRPVIVWSPEVSFVFDRSLDPKEIEKRLIARNIRFVSLFMIDEIYTLSLLKVPFFKALTDKYSSGKREPFAVAGNEVLYLLEPSVEENLAAIQ